jgi:hypothetical protein
VRCRAEQGFAVAAAEQEDEAVQVLAQLRGAVGGLGVVDNEQLTLGTADGELLAAERQVPGLRVVDAGRHALASLHVVPGPEPPESFAGQRQFAGELDETWVTGIASHGLAEAGDLRDNVTGAALILSVVCDRFANLDPATAPQGLGAYEEPGAKQVFSGGRSPITGQAPCGIMLVRF